MRGIGFLESLDGLAERDRRFAELTAGFVALRIAERAFRNGEMGASSLEPAREQIRRVTDLALANRLRQLVDAASPASQVYDGWREILAGRLMAYGLELHSAGNFGPAADVFTLVAEFTADGDLRLSALHQRAFALRLLQRFDESESTYDTLRQEAAIAGNRTMRLEADSGLARIALDRGNVPAAALLIDAVLSEARPYGETAIVTKALIDRARIAGLRGDPLGVLRESAEALELVETQARRHRILVNMAYAFRELGRASAAARVAREIASGAADAELRAYGRLVLYHLAIDAGDRAAADRLRGALAAVELSPAISAEYLEAVARDHVTRAEIEEAIRAITRMTRIATDHRLAELVLRGDAAMADIRKGRVPKVYLFQPPELSDRPQRRELNRIERRTIGQLVGTSGGISADPSAVP